MTNTEAEIFMDVLDDFFLRNAAKGRAALLMDTGDAIRALTGLRVVGYPLVHDLHPDDAANAMDEIQFSFFIGNIGATEIQLHELATAQPGPVYFLTTRGCDALLQVWALSEEASRIYCQAARETDLCILLGSCAPGGTVH